MNQLFPQARANFWVLLFIGYLTAALPGFAGDIDGRVVTLDNGLNVFVKEMPAAPVVAINIWVHVGSRNEKKGEEGFSHLIEHNLFKGTASYSVGMLDREIKKLGATDNAFTTSDYTCFHVIGAKENFSRLFELYSDAVLHSTMLTNEFEKEKQVVLEELRMGKDKPEDLAYNQLKELAFKVHPYRHPVIGYYDVVASATRDQVFGYYQKFYVPSNMWVVIVGDIKEAEAIEGVKKCFSATPKAAAPNQEIPNEPIQDRKRELTLYGDIQQTYLRMAWHAPGIESPDNYVLDVLSTLLGKGRSSRFYRTLVEQERLASDIECDYYTSGDPSLFILNAQLSQGNVRKFVDRATKVIEELPYEWATLPDKDSSIPRAELEKVKQQIIASTIFDRETAEAQALAYGHYATLGKLEDCDAYTDRIKGVTLEDLTRVSKSVFRPENLTVVSYEPRLLTATAPEMVVLENGVRLILKENHSSPLVAVAIQLDAGGLKEGKNEAGLANLTAATLLKGTEKRKAEEIARDFEAMGTSVSCSAQKSFATLRMVSLTEKFVPSLDLLLDIMSNANFPEEECKMEGEKALDAIKTQQDDLFAFTYYNTLSALFPGSPMGYSPLGLPEDVENLRQKDVVRFFKKHYAGQGMVVSIVGDFYTNEKKDAFIRMFSAFGKGESSELRGIKFPAIEGGKLVTAQKNREQAQIVFAARTFQRSDPRGLAMDVLKNILSGSMSSRLFTNLRDKESLAYSVWASNVGMVSHGHFFAALSTAAGKTDTAKTRLLEELTKIRTEGFTDEEFNDAKVYLLGQYALGLIDNISQADTFSSDEFFGLGFDYFLKYPEKIKAVKKEDVTAIAQEFMAGKSGYILGITKP